jgi:hypothetical protein
LSVSSVSTPLVNYKIDFSGRKKIIKALTFNLIEFEICRANYPAVFSMKTVLIQAFFQEK